MVRFSSVDSTQSLFSTGQPYLPKAGSVTELRFKKFFYSPSKRFSDQRGLVEKVVSIVTLILSAFLKAGLFLGNPGLVVIGFFVGVKWDGPTDTLDRIRLVWHKSSWWSTPLVTIAGFLTIPTIAAITSFLWAAEYGNYRYELAQN